MGGFVRKIVKKPKPAQTIQKAAVKAAPAGPNPTTTTS